jgi:hypothetical protein
MAFRVEAKNLVEGESYILEPFDLNLVFSFVRDGIRPLMSTPHRLTKIHQFRDGSYALQFAGLSLPVIPMSTFPNRERQIFIWSSALERLEESVNRKARQYRRQWDSGAGPGEGAGWGSPGPRPANKKYGGGKRRTSTTRKSKKSRARKQTRKA